MSLKLRVALASALTLLAFFSIASFGLQAVYKDSLNNAAEGELKAYMLSLLGELDIGESGQIELYDLSVAGFNQPNSGVFAEVWGENKLLWRSDSLIGKPLPKVTVGAVGEYRLNSALSEEQPYNLLSLLVDWQDIDSSLQFNMVVAHDAQPYIDRQLAFKKRLQFWLLTLGIFLLVLQLTLFQWLFRPIKQVRNELKSIQNGVQDKFSNVYPEEVSALTESLNSFLSNERKHIQNVRESLSNLAHSLKTPLAAIRSEISNKSTDETVVHAYIDRMSEVIDYQLSKTSSSVKPSYRQAKLCFPTIEKLVKVLQRLHHDKGIEINLSVENPKGLSFKGELDDLSEVLGNILENACKWANSRIRLEVKNVDTKLQILILDDGPGIAVEDVSDVLQRGTRLDTKTEGQGIGLSIVNDLVESYSGALKLESSSHYDESFSSGLAVLVVI